MSQHNQLYTVKFVVLDTWYMNLSAIGAPPSIFLTVKDEQESFMQIIIPEFVLDKWKDKLVKNSSYKVTDVILFRSSRKTKLIDSPYKLHFTDSTTVEQIDTLPISHGSSYTFSPLNQIPDFLPQGELSTASLCVRDIVCVVVNITPLFKRERRGRTVKFVEVYITDTSIWPNCALLTIWEDTAVKYEEQFLSGLNQHFVLVAQYVRPNLYKGKYGYQTNSFTRFTFNPSDLEPAASP